MSTTSAFDHMENKHTLYQEKKLYEKVCVFKRTRKKYNWF